MLESICTTLERFCCCCCCGCLFKSRTDSCRTGLCELRRCLDSADEACRRGDERRGHDDDDDEDESKKSVTDCGEDVRQSASEDLREIVGGDNGAAVAVVVWREHADILDITEELSSCCSTDRRGLRHM